MEVGIIWVDASNADPTELINTLQRHPKGLVVLSCWNDLLATFAEGDGFGVAYPQADATGTWMTGTPVSRGYSSPTGWQISGGASVDAAFLGSQELREHALTFARRSDPSGAQSGADGSAPAGASTTHPPTVESSSGTHAGAAPSIPPPTAEAAVAGPSTAPGIAAGVSGSSHGGTPAPVPSHPAGTAAGTVAPFRGLTVNATTNEAIVDGVVKGTFSEPYLTSALERLIEAQGRPILMNSDYNTKLRRDFERMGIRAGIYPEDFAGMKGFKLRYGETPVTWNGFSLDVATGKLTPPTGPEIDISAGKVNLQHTRLSWMERLMRARARGDAVPEMIHSRLQSELNKILSNTGLSITMSRMGKNKGTWLAFNP